MSPLLLAAFVLVAWELTRRPAGIRLPSWSLPRLPGWTSILASVVLAGGFAGSLALLIFQAGHDGSRPAFFDTLPFYVVYDVYAVYGPGRLHGVLSLASLAIAAIETCALATLVASASSDGPKSPALRLAPAVGGILAVLAVFAPVLSSNDAFGYVGLGMLGTQAYSQPAGFFHGEYARIFAQFPIRPTIYGPLWVALNSSIVSLGSNLVAKVLALRLFGMLLIVALLVLVRALRFGAAVQLAIALNPLLWLQFVVNAHNDLLAVLLVVAALLAVVRTRPTLAVVLLASAGLVKLPFLVIGAAVFGRARSARTALALFSAAVLLCLGLSAVFGGHAYYDALVQTIHLRGSSMSFAKTMFKAVILLLALVATAYVLIRRQYPVFAGWLYPVLGPIVFPWYFAWTIPYALAAERLVLPTLLVLPIAGVLSDTIYALDAVAMVLPFAALGALLVAARRAPERIRTESAAA